MFIDMSAFLVQALHLKAFLPGTLAEIVLCHPHKGFGFWRVFGWYFSQYLSSPSSLLPSLADQDSGGRKANTYLKYINQCHYVVIQVQVEQCSF